MAIRNFRHKGLEELFCKGHTSKVGSRLHKSALLVLDHLDAMTDLDDCKGVRDFHALKGNLKGCFSMSVSGNWRVIFRWDGENIHDVDLVDYH